MPTTPTFSPIAGAYTGEQTVTLTSTALSTIYYTLDGSTPSASSPLSVPTGGTVLVSSSATLQAMAVLAAVDSSVASGAYTITLSGIPTVVNVSSIGGIHQNSNLATGGGTDDTALIQAVLSAAYSGGLNLVVDGVSLITGLNVGSNTTITINAGCGFYLANGSNREAIRNMNRTALGTPADVNITITGAGEISCNKANQSAQADNTPNVGIGLYGVINVTINGGLTVFDANEWEIGIGNFNTVVVDHVNLTANAVTSNLTTDGIDLRGPGTNATLSNLTIIAGDDSIALNSRNYGSTVIGPYIAGGNISNVTIKNISMPGLAGIGNFGGIDLISDGTFAVSNVGISNISGLVQNYAFALNLDLFNTPAGVGNFSNITLNGSTVTQAGTPFGAPIPAGLYLIQGTTSAVQFANITPLPETINLTAAASVVTGLQIGNGTAFDANGIINVNLQGLTFVQQKSATAASGTSLTTTFTTQNCTLESWILVFVLVFPGSTVTCSGVSDGTSNTYVQAGFGSTGTSNCYIFQCLKNTSATKLAVKATFAGGSTSEAVILAMEYIGQNQSAPIDVISALLTATSATYSSNPITTSQLNETVIGLGFYSGASTFTATAPYTLRNFLAGSSGAEDTPATTKGTYTPTTTSASATFAWFTVAAFGQNPSVSGGGVTRSTRSK